MKSYSLDSMKKEIGRYSLVDLLEILEDANNPAYPFALGELSKRKPSDEDIKIAEKELAIRVTAKNRSLNSAEKLNAYLIPIRISLTSIGWITFYRKVNSEFDKQIRIFKSYDELKKAEEFEILRKKVKREIPIIILCVMIIGIIIVLVLN